MKNVVHAPHESVIFPRCKKILHYGETYTFFSTYFYATCMSLVFLSIHLSVKSNLILNKILTKIPLLFLS